MYMVTLRGEYVIESQNGEAGSHRAAATRGPIASWSRRSASRLRAYLAGARAVYDVMLTLTYPSWAEGGHDYDKAKRNLKSWYDRYRREHRTPGRSSVWVMEHTKAGTIHFHVLTNHFVAKDWLAASWYEVCGTEDPRHKAAGTRVEKLRDRSAGAKYLSKYLSKGSLGRMAAGTEATSGRWWGIVGSRSEVTAVIRVKESTEDAQYAALELKTKQNVLMDMLIQEGKAELMDTREWEGVPNTTQIWKVPDYRIRVGLVAVYRSWGFQIQKSLFSAEEEWDRDIFDDYSGLGLEGNQ